MDHLMSSSFNHSSINPSVLAEERNLRPESRSKEKEPRHYAHTQNHIPLPLLQEAIKSITRDLGHVGIGEEIVSLWLEYEDQSTPEARVVKDFDK